jgi:hypothetical protein
MPAQQGFGQNAQILRRLVLFFRNLLGESPGRIALVLQRGPHAEITVSPHSEIGILLRSGPLQSDLAVIRREMNRRTAGTDIRFQPPRSDLAGHRNGEIR